MSSRWYPLYQFGNPQRRVFLPNFFMKLVKNTYKDEILPNRVQFHVSMGMSRSDIIQYLNKIYNVPVVDARIFIKMGGTKLVGRKQHVSKEDDYKVVMVTLPENITFKFPDLFPQDKLDKQLDELNKSSEATKVANAFDTKEEKLRPGLPGWFGVKTAFKSSATSRHKPSTD